MLVLILSHLVAAAAQAQTLSLDDAIARALTANPDLHAVAAAEAEARERRAEAHASRFPRVTVEEGWQRGNQPVFVFGSLLAQRRFTEADFAVTALTRPDPLSNFRAAVAVSQPLYDGGSTAAASRAGDAMVALASVSRRAAAADVTVAVAQAYGQALTADATARAAVAAIDAALEDAARTRARHDEGVVTEADVLSIDVHLAQMRARRIAASADAQIARATLNRLMGAPLESAWDLAELDPAAAAAAAPVADPVAAVLGRPDVLQAAHRVDLARAQESSVRAALLPKVALDGGYEWNGAAWGARPSSWVFGIRAQWSLNAGGGERAAAAAAAHAVERARAEQASTEAAARLDALAASSRLEAARARLEVGDAAVAQARESARNVRDRYDAGLATITDVLRAADALLDAEALAVSAKVDVRVSTVVLNRALGRL